MPTSNNAYKNFTTDPLPNLDERQPMRYYQPQAPYDKLMGGSEAQFVDPQSQPYMYDSATLGRPFDWALKNVAQLGAMLLGGGAMEGYQTMEGLEGLDRMSRLGRLGMNMAGRGLLNQAGIKGETFAHMLKFPEWTGQLGGSYLGNLEFDKWKFEDIQRDILEEDAQGNMVIKRGRQPNRSERIWWAPVPASRSNLADFDPSTRKYSGPPIPPSWEESGDPDVDYFKDLTHKTNWDTWKARRAHMDAFPNRTFQPLPWEDPGAPPDTIGSRLDTRPKWMTPHSTVEDVLRQNGLEEYVRPSELKKLKEMWHNPDTYSIEDFDDYLYNLGKQYR